MSALTARSAVLAVLGLGACTWGGDPANFLPAARPQGVHAALYLTEPTERLSGELLAASDTAVVLATDEPAIVMVRYDRIVSGDFSQVGELIAGRAAPQPKAFTELKHLSRFPRGLSPELLAALLAAMRLDRLKVLP